MQVFDSPFEVKNIDADGPGSFEGYAAVFNNVDRGNDVILPGAIKAFETTIDGAVRLLAQHRVDQPIGKCRVSETPTGLAIKAKIDLSVSYAKDVYQNIKSGIVSGLSIGYDILDGGATMKPDGVRVLSRLKIWEISCVTFGMNPLATIDHVKGALDVADPRGFESAVRASLGLSKKQAKKLLAGGWQALIGGDSEQDEADEIADRLKELSAMMRGES